MNAPDPPNDQKTLFDLYQLYVETTETVCERRAVMNKWMLAVNGAITSLYGFLSSEKASVPAPDQIGWLIAIPISGAIMCLAWAAMLSSYRKINTAKFEVIHELEASLPAAPFLREKQIYEALDRRPLSQVEKSVPYVFMALYLVFVVLRLVSL